MRILHFIYLFRMKRLKTLKYPYILSFKGGSEIENEIYFATEQVDSLSTWIELNKFMDK